MPLEDLALDHQDAFAASLAHTVTTRRPGESALTALRRAFLQAAAGLLGTGHRLLFQRIQDVTLAGRPDTEISEIVTAKATHAFGLEPALAGYAGA